MPEPLEAGERRREQLAVAQRAFINAQELIRFMDQKAAFLLATVGVATTALATLTVTIIKQNADAPLWLLGPAGFLGVCYALVSVFVIWNATAVFAAKANTINFNTSAPGFLFPLIILKKHAKSEAKYAERLGASSSEELLLDYANQVTELSNIYSEKQSRINLTLTLFQTLIAFWTIEILILGMLSVI